MFKISVAQLWVHDQDEALDFYTKKVGGPPGQPDVGIVLMAIPGPPVMDEATADDVRRLMAKGFAGTVFLTTDDINATYDELTDRGVEFTEKPEQRPYGMDSAFRVPSGNSIRLTQVSEVAAA